MRLNSDSPGLFFGGLLTVVPKFVASYRSFDSVVEVQFRDLPATMSSLSQLADCHAIFQRNACLEFSEAHHCVYPEVQPKSSFARLTLPLFPVGFESGAVVSVVRSLI